MFPRSVDPLDPDSKADFTPQRRVFGAQGASQHPDNITPAQ